MNIYYKLVSAFSLIISTQTYSMLTPAKQIIRLNASNKLRSLSYRIDSKKLADLSDKIKQLDIRVYGLTQANYAEKLKTVEIDLLREQISELKRIREALEKLASKK